MSSVSVAVADPAPACALRWRARAKTSGASRAAVDAMNAAAAAGYPKVDAAVVTHC